ncbi:hypothetical protein LCGC14_2607350 [marine sediment metagenome]|uniref:Uncharacterized protein n=1 Tax=marine sediment metagenome TaxID=412755 RepID=A0A0F9CZP7_9ZZZZ
MSLTREELDIVDLLGQAYNLFASLPRDTLHPTAKDEFASAIHNAQHLVMIQSAVRAHPETFVTIGGGVTMTRDGAHSL